MQVLACGGGGGAAQLLRRDALDRALAPGLSRVEGGAALEILFEEAWTSLRALSEEGPYRGSDAELAAIEVEAGRVTVGWTGFMRALHVVGSRAHKVSTDISWADSWAGSEGYDRAVAAGVLSTELSAKLGRDPMLSWRTRAIEAAPGDVVVLTTTGIARQVVPDRDLIETVERAAVASRAEPVALADLVYRALAEPFERWRGEPYWLTPKWYQLRAGVLAIRL